MIEPFPYADAPRLMTVQIHDTARNEPGGRPVFSGPELVDYIEQNHVFDRVIASQALDVLHTSGEGTERLEGYLVTPGTFEFFGMRALRGRAMQPADYEPGAPPVFVLRYKAWMSRFNGDPAILDRQFVLNGTSRTLIGIMPPRFAWGDADLWIVARVVRERLQVPTDQADRPVTDASHRAIVVRDVHFTDLGVTRLLEVHAVDA